jgi:hypothetical protein
MEDTAMGVTEESAQMSFVQRLAGIFFEPTKTFEDINRKSTWFVMFLVMAVLGLVLAYAMVSHLDTVAMMRQQMEARNMSEAQINQAIEAQQSNPLIKNLMYLGVIVAPIAQLVSYLVITGVLLLMFIMMGAPLTFRKTLAVTVWGMSPAGIVNGLLSIVLLYIKNPDTIDATQGILMSNLAPLVSSKANPFLHSVLGSLDLFSFWTIVMLSLGLPAISGKRLTIQKAAMGVIILWAIYVLGKSGIRMIFPS